MGRVKYGKLSRREQTPLHPKAEKILSRRSFPPGAHGAGSGRRNKLSEFGTQLREKQKTKRAYGVSEQQFKNYYLKAIKKKGITGEIMLQFLEMRLDNVIYSLGFARSRPLARQLVTHGHVTVGGKKVTIPSFQVKSGDVIAIREGSRAKNYFRALSEPLSGHSTPSWLTLTPKDYSGKVNAAPSRSDIDQSISEQLIVEFYSR